MNEIEKAKEYFEDAARKADEIIEDCSKALQAELLNQKEHFVTALKVLQEKAESEKGCEHCRGWDSRCGATTARCVGGGRGCCNTLCEQSRKDGEISWNWM